jgi:hypothetical protein
MSSRVMHAQSLWVLIMVVMAMKKLLRVLNEYLLGPDLSLIWAEECWQPYTHQLAGRKSA